MFRGDGFGARGESTGEVVFNTSITGYQEIVTDPSYRGQIVVMTAPEIGNVGVNPIDIESARPWCAGLRDPRAVAAAVELARRGLAATSCWPSNGVAGIDRHRHARAHPALRDSGRAARR